MILLPKVEVQKSGVSGQLRSINKNGKKTLDLFCHPPKNPDAGDCLCQLPIITLDFIDDGGGLNFSWGFLLDIRDLECIHHIFHPEMIRKDRSTTIRLVCLNRLPRGFFRQQTTTTLKVQQLLMAEIRLTS